MRAGPAWWLAAAGAALALLALLGPDPDRAPRAPALLAVDGGRAERATGFAVRDETVVTVAHALTGGQITVNGRPATIVTRDEAADIAVLHVPGIRSRPLEIADADHVLSAHVDGVTREVIRLDRDVRPGQSGTPVIRDGRLVGVIFARSTAHPHTAYAVAGASLRQITASRASRRDAIRTPSSVRTG